MNHEKIDKLFNEYEKSFSALDFKAIAGFYTDQFITAGPKGIISNNKQEFIEKATQASEFYKNVGQTSATIISKSVADISPQYAMVKVHWGVTFKKTGDRPIEFDISYLVSGINGEPKIILFISHEDEEEAMKKLSII